MTDHDPARLRTDAAADDRRADELAEQGSDHGEYYRRRATWRRRLAQDEEDFRRATERR